MDGSGAESKEGSSSTSELRHDTRHKYPFAQAGQSGSLRESTGAFLKVRFAPRTTTLAAQP